MNYQVDSSNFWSFSGQNRTIIRLIDSVCKWLLLLSFIWVYDKQLQINQKLWSVTLFTISICDSRKKSFKHLFTFTIIGLTCTYVLAGLAHFTYSASIVWNRKTQRSLVRGRSTSIYIYSVYYQKHCSFFILSTVFLFVKRDGIYVPTSKWLHPIWIYFVCYDLKEFAFSHDKATSSLKEYFQALEMDKMHIYVVFTY